MTTLAARFQQACNAVFALQQRPDNDTLLRLYALYKQSTEGDVRGTRPGVFNVVGAAKHDAWAVLAGTSKPQAQRDYIALVNALVADQSQ